MSRRKKECCGGCAGPMGPRGPAGSSDLKFYFAELKQSLDLGDQYTLIASVLVGNLQSPIRTLLIGSSFTATALNLVPPLTDVFADFIIRIDAGDLFGGASLTFEAADTNTGAILRSSLVDAGPRQVALYGRKRNAPGAIVRILPVGPAPDFVPMQGTIVVIEKTGGV